MIIMAVNMRIRLSSASPSLKQYLKKVADNLKVTGEVHNVTANQLFVEVEGDDPRVDEFLKACQKLLKQGMVSGILYDSNSVKGYEEFVINV